MARGIFPLSHPNLAFIDTMELVIPYDRVVSLDEILKLGQLSGFQINDGRKLFKSKNSVFLAPRKFYRHKNIHEKVEFQLDGVTPMDAPTYGPYEKKSFGWITFHETYAYIHTTLGYFIRGHNLLMDCAKESSRAIREFLDGLKHYFPFMRIENVNFRSLDVTYQFRIADYEKVHAQIFGTQCRLSNMVDDVMLHKSHMVSGSDGTKRRWSIYDKHKQVKEVMGDDIESLKGIVRITEQVKRTNNRHQWDPLWEDEHAVELSQQGLLDTFTKRWDGMVLVGGDFGDIIAGLCKLGHNLFKIGSYVHFKEVPSHLGILQNNTESSKGKYAFTRWYKNAYGAIDNDVANVLGYALRIPKADSFKDWESSLCIEAFSVK